VLLLQAANTPQPPYTHIFNEENIPMPASPCAAAASGGAAPPSLRADRTPVPVWGRSFVGECLWLEGGERERGPKTYMTFEGTEHARMTPYFIQDERGKPSHLNMIPKVERERDRKKPFSSLTWM